MYGWGNERSENRVGKNRGEIFIGLSSLLYADDLRLCGESKNLRVMEGQLVEVC